IEVPNVDEKLRPKMTANVTIDVATVRDVMRIPNGALRFKPETDAKDDKDQKAETTSSASNEPEREAARMGRRGRGIEGGASALGANTPAPPKRQTVYILGPDKKPKAVQVRTGISDGHY